MRLDELRIQRLFHVSDTFLHFETMATQSRPLLKNRGHIPHFLLVLKIKGQGQRRRKPE